MQEALGLMNLFRPSDVCIGPDGAIYVADWFDARVVDMERVIQVKQEVFTELHPRVQSFPFPTSISRLLADKLKH